MSKEPDRVHTDSQHAAQVCLQLDDFDVRRYREELGLTQAEFAKDMKVSLHTLRKWEGGTVAPTFGEKFRAVLQSWLQRETRRLFPSQR